jgi:aminomethyltransferase
VGGRRVLLSRSGYTGEDGFEIYCESRFGPELWDLLLASREVSPVGLGARDTLRLEMKYPLHGNDITPDDSPLEAGLGWAVKFNHPFIGREALEAQKLAGVQRKLVGFVLKSNSIARSHYKVRTSLGDSGEVRSGTKTPTTEKSIGLCYLPAALAQVGAAFEVEIRGQWNPAEVVQTPFVKPRTVVSA